MEVNLFITGLAIVPFLGLILSFLIREKNEILISRVAFYTIVLQLVLSAVFSVYWVVNDASPLNIKELVIYQSSDYEFFIDFYFDKVTAVYLLIGAFITSIIARYSRYYMHLENGYKRYFNTMLLFFAGYNFTVLAGNFETLFIGWEFLGISSFLLIAFYRDRYLPVKNALKVFSVYRIGDVGILLAMWASHHLWHENITFFKLNNYDLVHEHLISHAGISLFISLCLLVAAAAKSAQFPFSYWLPRAMEGPTPSSAIFYGSLSVHFGVFLLLRTAPFWEHLPVMKVLIAGMGITTALVAYHIAKVQATIKTQIAYASMVQIGIMFIEIALGFYNLALLHFAGNAFLRTYQLLVSPSVVSYMIRDQFYHYEPEKMNVKSNIRTKVEYTIYMLALREFFLDRILSKLVFTPIKKIGSRLDFLTPTNLIFVFTPLYLAGLYFYFNQNQLPLFVRNHLPEAFSLIGLVMVFKAFSEKKFPRLAWMLIVLNHFWIALAVSFNEFFDYKQVLIYLSGVVLSGFLGLAILHILRKKESKYFDLNNYYGHAYDYPKLSFIFLLAGLGLMGFPVTTTFLGEDLIFSHIHSNQFVLAFANALSFVMAGIAVIRMYARLFLGPHAKSHHSTPLKSS
jgi:NADH-quinone oxidoreductase subunit L